MSIITEKKGDVDKHFRLGVIFHEGIHVEKDLDAAKEQFKAGWENGDKRCGFNYALMLDNEHANSGGRGVPSEAYQIFEQVTDFCPDAFYYTGDFTIGSLQGSDLCSLALAKEDMKDGDVGAAKTLLERVACSNNRKLKAASCELLGIMKKNGGDSIGALNELTFAADEGLKESQYHLGLLLKTDPVKIVLAADEFKKASDQGHTLATFELGKIYRDSFAWSEEDATKLLKQASEEGCKEASLELGNWYQDQANYFEAWEWYNIAGEKEKCDEVMSLALDRADRENHIDYDNAFQIWKKYKTARSSYWVGKSVINGWGCIPKPGYALPWFDDTEYIPSMLIMAMYYMDGLGSIRQDYSGCLNILERVLNLDPDEQKAKDMIRVIYESSTDTRDLDRCKQLLPELTPPVPEEDEFIRKMKAACPPSLTEKKVNRPLSPIAMLKEEQNAAEAAFSEISDDYVKLPGEPYGFDEDEGNEFPQPPDEQPWFTKPQLEVATKRKYIGEPPVPQLSHAEMVINGHEDNPKYQYIAGCIYQVEGKLEEAKAWFKKAAKVGDRDSLIKLGEISLEE